MNREKLKRYADAVLASVSDIHFQIIHYSDDKLEEIQPEIDATIDSTIAGLSLIADMIKEGERVTGP